MYSATLTAYSTGYSAHREITSKAGLIKQDFQVTVIKQDFQVTAAVV
jgi:hypothetical protein